MRTLSTALRKVYEAEGGYAVHSRARISNNGGSSWTDLRTLKDRDFYLGASWTESVDQGIVELHLFLKREVDGWNLSPNMESNPLNLAAGAYTPLLRKAFTRVQVQVAIRPLHATAPDSSDWLTVFEGLLVSFSAGGEDGTLDCYCRDLGDLLMHTNFIEEEVEYGSDVGTPLEDVIQDILDGNGFSGVALYTPTSPGWDLGRYKQRCEPVFTAAETLAMQLGWRVSYHFDAADAYRFTLWAPDRDATSSVYTLKDYQRLAVPSFGAETDYIRNAVEIVYFDKADLDASGQPKMKRVMVDKDYAGDAAVAALAAASETAHGRRFMRYAPAAGANIDTQSEAERLGEAAIKDLADPMVDFEVETPYLHFLQLGDLITVPADDVNHDTALDAAVTVLRHALTADGRVSTTLGLRGRPQGARQQWMVRMAHPAVTRPLTLTGPDAPTNVVTESTTEGLLVWFDEPLRGVKPFEYELHLSTSSGFTPSAATLFATSRTNNFTVTGYESGTTYYAKVVPRSAPLEANRAGIPGTASSQATVVPRYVEPRRLQPRVSYAALPLNSDFEAANDAAAAPDGWGMTAGTWGTDAELVTTAYTGGNAVRMRSGGVLSSQLWAARPSVQYSLDAVFYPESVTTASGEIKVEWFDAAFVSLGIDSANSIIFSGALNTWARGTEVSTTPANTRYMRVNIYGDEFTAGRSTIVDSVIVREQNSIRADFARLTDPSLGDGTTDYQNSWVPYGTGAGQYVELYLDPNTGFVDIRGQVKSGVSGAVAFTLFVGYRPFGTTYRLAYSAGAASATVEIRANGDVYITSASTTQVDLGGISFPTF